jgi:hypothetical protein
MNKKQYSMMLVLAVFAGFVGGEVASRVFTLHPAFAQKTSRPVEIIEAQEFRLVDKDGKTKARLTMRNGKLLAEIPDLTRWTIRLLEEAKEKE